MSPVCRHLASGAAAPAPADTCDPCVETGSTWLNLRLCLTCGVTRCCDSSPNRHMTGHF